MYFDLNVPVSAPASLPHTHGHKSKKSKGKQPATQVVVQQDVVYSAAQIAKLEARIDLLVRLGYSVIAFNQTVVSKVDPRSHVNVLDPLLKQLRKREGVLYLKRLTIELDEESEKGNGLSTGNTSLFTPYDILALRPTTQTTLSSACLTHTQPSPLTTHIISVPLTEQPRLPFRLKHTLVRTAIKNGAVFEINYAGALGEQGDVAGAGGAGAGAGDERRRNWWAAAREVGRVTKGKGLIVSGGVENDQFLRAPRDVGNLIALLGLAQNLAHDAATTTPKSLLLRAQTRKTYRAVLSEPTLILSSRQPSATVPEEATGASAVASLPVRTEDIQADEAAVTASQQIANDSEKDARVAVPEKPEPETQLKQSNGAKRPFDAIDETGPPTTKVTSSEGTERKKKKKKRGKTAEGDAA